MPRDMTQSAEIGLHDFQRTIPTDGRWCQVCGLPEARWSGDPCPGPEGALRRLEARMVTRPIPPGVDPEANDAA